MGPLSFPHECRCSASFPQGGALWMNAGSDRWPGGSEAELTPFQWEILFSKKLPTSHCRLESVARPFLLSLPSGGRTENKKKKQGTPRSAALCGRDGAVFGLTRSEDKIREKGDRKERKKQQQQQTARSRCRWQTARWRQDSASTSLSSHLSPVQHHHVSGDILGAGWVLSASSGESHEPRRSEPEPRAARMPMNRRYLRDNKQGVSVTGLRRHADTHIHNSLVYVELFKMQPVNELCYKTALLSVCCPTSQVASCLYSRPHRPQCIFIIKTKNNNYYYNCNHRWLFFMLIWLLNIPLKKNPKPFRLRVPLWIEMLSTICFTEVKINLMKWREGRRANNQYQWQPFCHWYCLSVMVCSKYSVWWRKNVNI